MELTSDENPQVSTHSGVQKMYIPISLSLTILSII